MDPEYLAMLQQMLGVNFYRPYIPNTGGQYRSQFTDYISDGNVPLNKALGDTNKFSPDAFLDLDPRLKGIVARAVSQQKHDPFGTYAAFDDPEYQYQLLQMALRDFGVEPLDIEIEEDQYGRKKFPNVEDYLRDLDDTLGPRKRTHRSGDGEMVTFETPYSQILRQRLRKYTSQLDDFFTQAAPTQERNLNDIDFLWSRLGGMPFPGQGMGSQDRAGSGPAFPAAGGGRSRNTNPDAMQFALQQMRKAKRVNS
jgi:hypothetical protein